MREIKITISTTNDAFYDGEIQTFDSIAQEFDNILNFISVKLDKGVFVENLHDRNGNLVGKVEYK